MRSNAVSVAAYLAELRTDRRAAMEAIREVMVQSVPLGVEEGMNWGMIAYQIPLERYPTTYNGQPLLFAALASQKNYMSVYLSGVYSDPGLRAKFENAYRNSGKPLDMGASCVRFRKLEDVPMGVIEMALRALDVDEFIAIYEASRRKR